MAMAAVMAMAGGVVLDVFVDLFERDFGGFHGGTRGVEWARGVAARWR